MVHFAEQLVGLAVVADIHHDVEVHAAHRLFEDAFCLTGSEPRNFAVHDVCRALISCKSKTVLVLTLALHAPLGEVSVDFFAELTAARKRNKPERSYRDAVENALFTFSGCFHLFRFLLQGQVLTGHAREQLLTIARSCRPDRRPGSSIL